MHLFTGLLYNLFNLFVYCVVTRFSVQPPGSGINVTKQQLVNALNEVLTSSPVFAQYCLPLLLEKLASSAVDAKVDSLQTLVSLWSESLEYCSVA
jgi:hypothetical protein